MEHYSVAVIGGGAAGLVCAVALHRYGIHDFVLLERNDRLGKKLSATGNGQGNLTNLDMGAEHYFTADPDKVRGILARFSQKQTIAFFTSLGGLTLSDERGRVYPASRQASSVTDLLRFELEARHTAIKLGFSVAAIERGFVLLSDRGERIGADFVVQCTGGKAAKQFGTDGSAYALARGFGHTVTPLYPSLVQLRTEPTEPTLKGIRSDVCLHYGSVAVRGDLLFTDYGISGDAVFRLSSYFAGKERAPIFVEFLPDVPQDTLLNLLRDKKAPAGELLCGVVNNQIGRAILKRSASAEEAVRLLKAFPLTVTGTLGFPYAQVTRGGVPLSEVTDGLESKKQSGYYLCGELLDVDGECGGYNLQWAFAGGFVAAEEIACRR